MIRLGYPEREAHVFLHNAFIDELMAMKAALFKRTLSGPQFCDLFRNWLTRHIMAEDRKIAVFVRSRAAVGLAGSNAWARPGQGGIAEGGAPESGAASGADGGGPSVADLGGVFGL